MSSLIEAEADTSDDGALVAAHLCGDQTAFSRLYTRHYPRVVRALRRRTGDSGLAEDLAQVAFMRAFARLHTFEQARPFSPWVHTIADNVATDHFRRRTAEGAEPLDEELESPEHDGDAVAEELVERLVLHEALRQLPRRQRIALMLCYLVGVAPVDAAALLGISRPAFDKLASRAREGLRREYRRLSGPASLRGWALAPVAWLWRLWRTLRDQRAVTDPGTLSVVSTPACQVLLAALVALPWSGQPLHPASASVPAVAPATGVPLRALPDHTLDAVPPRSTAAPQHVSPPASLLPPGRSVEERSVGAAQRGTPPSSTVQFNPIAVPGTRHRFHQQAPAQPDYRYGVALPRPGDERLRVGQESKDEETTAPLDAVACDLARAGDPLTYCEQP